MCVPAYVRAPARLSVAPRLRPDARLCMIACLFAAIFLFISGAAADQAAERTAVLDIYIDQAIESNLALKQRDFSYKKNIAELNEARALFLPSIHRLEIGLRTRGG